MRRAFRSLPERLACVLAAIFVFDRLLKLLAVVSFFRRPRPAPPERWPTVTLLQPITRGASSLLDALRARARLVYPASIQHLLICDAQDMESQAIVAAYLDEFPELCAELILVEPENSMPGAVARKLDKLQAALPRASGEVLCFVDDDVILRPDNLRVLVPYLFQPGVGLAFGLPCFTNWQTVWSSLISALINAHMLLSLASLTFLIDPIRINGHVFAFRREIFEHIGGFDGMERQIDDEFAIPQRLRAYNLRAMQTPSIYDIDNALDSARAYTRQFKRWFVMPRQAMMPSLTLRQKLIAALVSFTLPLPGIMALLALWARRRSAWLALIGSLGIFAGVYALCERRYLQRPMPLKRWLLLPVVALWTPLQIVWTMLRGDEVEWRGQRLLLRRDGTAEIVQAEGGRKQ
jgi:ceramide glucosyltransferase